MTEIYFVRHAEPDYRIHDDMSRPLTEKGRRDCRLVTEYLKDKIVELVVSSPFRRAYDTVCGLAESMGLEVICMDAFRERKITDGWLDDFRSYSERQWMDFDYKLENGECLAEVQERSVAALNTLLTAQPDRTIVIGTHGTALSAIINYYDRTFSYADFQKIAGLMPFITHFSFNGNACVLIELVNLFSGEISIRLRKGV